MDHQRPSQTTAKQKAKDKQRNKPMQAETNDGGVHSTNLYKVAPVIVKGLSNTSRRALDGVLREKLPGVKIDNIIYNQKTKLYTIQPTDIHSHQQLLDNFPQDSFPNDKNPVLFVPSSIRQVIESESVCFLKDVDLEYNEDELRHALQSEGILIKQLVRITRPAEGTASRKFTTTVKVICKDKKNRDTLIRTGLRISFCIFRCEPAKPNDIPLQCKRCNSFGHIMKYCKAENEICARCGEHHPTMGCQSSTIKCSNCSSNHEATSKQCPIFIERQKKLKKTIDEYTTPIQQLPPIASQVDYPHLLYGSTKPCSCTQDLLSTKFDAIAEQLKATNELVHNLTATVVQLTQMQQTILTALAQQQQTGASMMPPPFQPPPTLTYRFPPPPPPNSSPDQHKRPTKQQKRDETIQQQTNTKPFDCAASAGQTPNGRPRRTSRKPNSISSPSIAGSPADIVRIPQTIIPAPDTTMELDQQQ